MEILRNKSHPGNKTNKSHALIETIKRMKKDKLMKKARVKEIKVVNKIEMKMTLVNYRL